MHEALRHYLNPEQTTMIDMRLLYGLVTKNPSKIVSQDTTSNSSLPSDKLKPAPKSNKKSNRSAHNATGKNISVINSSGDELDNNHRGANPNSFNDASHVIDKTQ